MAIGIDAPPTDYALSWSPSSQIPLEDFLGKNQPTTTFNDRANKKPYIWVLGSKYTPPESYKECLKEAKVILNETAQQVMKIKNNPDIPTRAKKGVRNKKQMREEIQKSASDSLKEVAVKHGFVAGKWLAFLSEEEVDTIFSDVACSLISGDLSSTVATHVGINTSPYSEDAKLLYYLAVYFPNVYEEDMAREVMKVLIEKHGLKLTGAKPNLYTSIYLTSKHGSGIPVSVWTGQGGPGSLMTKDEIAALRPTHTGEQASNDGGTEKKKAREAIKAKNRTQENPYDSEDEGDEPITLAPTKRLRDSDDYEVEGEPPHKMTKLGDASRLPRRARLRSKRQVVKKYAHSGSDSGGD